VVIQRYERVRECERWELAIVIAILTTTYEFMHGVKSSCVVLYTTSNVVGGTMYAASLHKVDSSVGCAPTLTTLTTLNNTSRYQARSRATSIVVGGSEVVGGAVGEEEFEE
jgi:hypothetical protein